MLSAEERSLHNGGNGDGKPTPLVDAQTGAPVYERQCSNLRKHGPHIWRFAADPREARVCSGRKENTVD